MSEKERRSRTPRQRQDSSALVVYVSSMRPWSLSASLLPVVLGATLSYRDSLEFSLPIFLLTAASVICVHMAGNLINTYYDYKYGVDTSRLAEDRTLVDNCLRPTDVTHLSTLLYSVGVLAFLLVSYLSPLRVEVSALLFFVGLSGSFLYTGGIGLKYYALGDVLVLILFGPVAVTYSYMLQCGTFAIKTVMFATPLALNTESILHSNNTRDIEADVQAGVRTIASVIGKETSYFLYCFLLFSPYLMLTYPACKISYVLLLPYVTINYAFDLELQFRQGSLDKLPQKTAKLNLTFGLLYILSILISTWIH